MALGTGPSIADGLGSWRDELFSQGNADQVYLVATIEGEQAAMGVTVAGRDTEDEKNGGGSTPAGMRLLTGSSPDRGSVLIHLDQHFINRGPCPSERERTLKALDSGHIIRWLSPSTILIALIRTPGVICRSLPLLQTGFRARANRPGLPQVATFYLFDPESQRGEECLRGSQTICSL